MSRIASAAYSKALAGKTTRGPQSLQRYPRSGTRIGTVYALLKRNKGRYIYLYKYLATSKNRAFMVSLRDFYGLEIMTKYGVKRSPKHPHSRYKLYCLAGEWIGIDYVDYTKAAKGS